MKFGFRVPSLKRRFSARTSLKRFVRHSMGLKMPKGTGFITNPKRAVYNKVYNKTSFSIGRFFSGSRLPKTNNVIKQEELNGKNIQLTVNQEGSINCPRCGINMGQPYTKGIFNKILEYVCPNCNLKAEVGNNIEKESVNDFPMCSSCGRQYSSQTEKCKYCNIVLSQKKIGGYIGLFDLTDWWLTEFSEEERKHMENAYHPMGHPPDENSLTEGSITSTSNTASNFLNGFSSWFTGPEYRHLARKILQKAQELNKQADGGKINVLDEHFVLSEMIPMYYRDREKDGMLDKAIDACKKQISLAPQSKLAFLKEYPNQALPGHRGYEQLVIILDKQEKIEEAIALCKQAKEEGWSGDWNSRTERYSNKLKKAKAN